MARRDHDPTLHYQIRLGAGLSPSWATWFEGMRLSTKLQDGQPPITVLTGPVADQAALFGLLCRIRDLGLPLISVNPVSVDAKE